MGRKHTHTHLPHAVLAFTLSGRLCVPVFTIVSIPRMRRALSAGQMFGTAVCTTKGSRYNIGSQGRHASESPAMSYRYSSTSHVTKYFEVLRKAGGEVWPSAGPLQATWSKSHNKRWSHALQDSRSAAVAALEHVRRRGGGGGLRGNTVHGHLGFANRCPTKARTPTDEQERQVDI